MLDEGLQTVQLNPVPGFRAVKLQDDALIRSSHGLTSYSRSTHRPCTPSCNSFLETGLDKEWSRYDRISETSAFFGTR